MKQKIVPGGEIEAATQAELVAAVSEAVAGLAGTPDVVRGSESGTTNAAGLLELPVYLVPPGQSFMLTRLLVDAGGFTFAVPFNGAGAYVDVLRNDQRVDGASLVAAAAGGKSLPALFTASESAAEVFANGDALVVKIVAGPVSTGILVRFRGLQYAAQPS